MDDFMAAHPNAGGLGINWLIFGSSHHEKRPAGGVLENFTMCAQYDWYNNNFTKYICNPPKILAAHVHCPLLRKGFHYMYENGEIYHITSPREIHFDKIRINHYFCKSLEEYTIIKMGRGDVLYGALTKKLKAFHDHDKNDIIDTEILSRR